MTDPAAPILEELDFLYTPSRDVAADMADFTAVLGGRLVFAIEDSGIRVAMIELAGAPRVLLTDHLDGEHPILVYRVADLDAAVAALRDRGWTPERSLEIPHGPCSSFRSPGGHRVAPRAVRGEEREMRAGGAAKDDRARRFGVIGAGLRAHMAEGAEDVRELRRECRAGDETVLDVVDGVAARGEDPIGDRGIDTAFAFVAIAPASAMHDDHRRMGTRRRGVVAVETKRGVVRGPEHDVVGPADVWQRSAGAQPDGPIA